MVTRTKIDADNRICIVSATIVPPGEGIENAIDRFHDQLYAAHEKDLEARSEIGDPDEQRLYDYYRTVGVLYDALRPVTRRYGAMLLLSLVNFGLGHARLYLGTGRVQTRQVGSGDIQHLVTLELNRDMLKQPLDMATLITELIEVLGHEMVHVEQTRRRDVTKPPSGYVSSDADEIGYLSSPQEVNAKAWNVLTRMIRDGYITARELSRGIFPRRLWSAIWDLYQHESIPESARKRLMRRAYDMFQEMSRRANESNEHWRNWWLKRNYEATDEEQEAANDAWWDEYWVKYMSGQPARIARTLRPPAPTPGVYYHGTSEEKLPTILTEGLKAGSGTEFAPAVAKDRALSKTPAVYLTTWFEQAVRYAQGLARDADPAVIEVRLDPEQVREDLMDNPRRMRWENLKNPFKPGNPMMKGQIPITQFMHPADIPPEAIAAVHVDVVSFDKDRAPSYVVPSLAGETVQGYEAARRFYFALKRMLDSRPDEPSGPYSFQTVAKALSEAAEELDELGIDADEFQYTDWAELWRESPQTIEAVVQQLHTALFTPEGVGYAQQQGETSLRRYTPEEYLQRTAGAITVTAADAKTPIVAAHNLTAENLRYADKIGGLIAPSIAIFNPEHGFSNFGEITLLAPMSLVDPDTTPVYDADVYSPRYPAVYHKPEGKALRQFEEAYRPYAERTKAYIGDLAHNIEYRGGSEEGLRQMLAPLRLAFLEQVKGMQIESVMRQVPVDPEWVGAPSLTAFFAAHGRDVNARMDSPYWDAFSQAAQQAVREFYAPLDPEDREMMLDASFDHYFEAGPGRLFFGRGDKILRAAGNVGKSEVDQYAFRDRLEELIAPYEAEFETWARPQVESLVAGQYLKTPGGAKREYTPENVLKAMTPKDVRGGEGFNYGLGSLRAKGAKKFRSLDQMERASDKLVSAEEMEQRKKQLQDRFWVLAKKLAPYHPASGEFRFSDAVLSALGESFKRGHSLPGELRRDGFKDVPSELVQELSEFKEELVNAPTQYFEAKPKRVVSLDEFVGAVIPDDAPRAILDIVERHGLKTVTYTRGDDASRAAAVQSFAGQSRTAMSEKALDKLRLQYPEHEAAFEEFVRTDPTGQHKYVPWAMRQVSKGLPTWAIREALFDYHRYSDRVPGNLDKYRSLVDLAHALQPVMREPEPRSVSEDITEDSSLPEPDYVKRPSEGTQYLGLEGDYDVFEVSSYDGSRALGTRNWCVARSRKIWDDYAKKGITFRYLVNRSRGLPAEYALAIHSDAGMTEVYGPRDEIVLQPPKAAEKYGEGTMAADELDEIVRAALAGDVPWQLRRAPEFIHAVARSYSADTFISVLGQALRAEEQYAETHGQNPDRSVTTLYRLYADVVLRDNQRLTRKMDAWTQMRFGVPMTRMRWLAGRGLTPELVEEFRSKGIERVNDMARIVRQQKPSQDIEQVTSALAPYIESGLTSSEALRLQEVAVSPSALEQYRSLGVEELNDIIRLAKPYGRYGLRVTPRMLAAFQLAGVTNANQIDQMRRVNSRDIAFYWNRGDADKVVELVRKATDRSLREALATEEQRTLSMVQSTYDAADPAERERIESAATEFGDFAHFDGSGDPNEYVEWVRSIVPDAFPMWRRAVRRTAAMKIRAAKRRGYKVVVAGEDGFRSLYDGTPIPTGRHTPPGGLYLGTSEEFVRDYYLGLTDEPEAILTYEYDDADLLSGDPESTDGEVKVRSAVLVDAVTKVAAFASREASRKLKRRLKDRYELIQPAMERDKGAGTQYAQFVELLLRENKEIDLEKVNALLLKLDATMTDLGEPPKLADTYAEHGTKWSSAFEWLEDFEDVKTRDLKRHLDNYGRESDAKFEVISDKIVRTLNFDAACYLHGRSSGRRHLPWCGGMSRGNYAAYGGRDLKRYIVYPEGADTKATINGQEIPFSSYAFTVSVTSDGRLNNINDPDNNYPDRGGFDMNGAEAALDTLNDAIGLSLSLEEVSDDTPEGWDYYDFDAAEAQEWIDAGFNDPEVAERWRNAGFDAGDAAIWDAIEEDVRRAKELHDEDVSPVDYGEAKEYGIDRILIIESARGRGPDVTLLKNLLEDDDAWNYVKSNHTRSDLIEREYRRVWPRMTEIRNNAPREEQAKFDELNRQYYEDDNPQPLIAWTRQVVPGAFVGIRHLTDAQLHAIAARDAADVSVQDAVWIGETLDDEERAANITSHGIDWPTFRAWREAESEVLARYPDAANPDSLIYDLMAKGVALDAWQAWEAARPDAPLTNLFRDATMYAEFEAEHVPEVARFVDFGVINPKSISDWIVYNFSPEEAKAWMDAGWTDAVRAARQRKMQLTHSDPQGWSDEIQGYAYYRGLEYDDAAKEWEQWMASGIDPKKIIEGNWATAVAKLGLADAIRVANWAQTVDKRVAGDVRSFWYSYDVQNPNWFDEFLTGELGTGYGIGGSDRYTMLAWANDPAPFEKKKQLIQLGVRYSDYSRSAAAGDTADQIIEAITGPESRQGHLVVVAASDLGVPFLSTCDRLRRRGPEGEAVWQEIIENAQSTSSEDFLAAVNLGDVLDEGESAHEWLAVHPDAKFYRSRVGDHVAYFMDTAGFEFIFAPPEVLSAKILATQRVATLDEELLRMYEDAPYDYVRELNALDVKAITADEADRLWHAIASHIENLKSVASTLEWGAQFEADIADLHEALWQRRNAAHVEATINVVDEAPEHHDQLIIKQPGKLQSQDVQYPGGELNDDPSGADPAASERRREGATVAREPTTTFDALEPDERFLLVSDARMGVLVKTSSDSYETLRGDLTVGVNPQSRVMRIRRQPSNDLEVEAERGFNLTDLTERETLVPHKMNPYRDWSGESYRSWNQYEDPMDKMGRLVQRSRDGEKQWALVSKSNPDKVLKWFGPEKPSKEDVSREERRVQFFKHQGMAMFTPEDLPDDWSVIVEEDTGEAHIKLLDDREEIVADLVVDLDRGDVLHAHAKESGWGPLLYEVAMELMTDRGGTLQSDPRLVTDDAAHVWDRFHARDDLGRVQLERKPPSDKLRGGKTRQEKSLQFGYTKERQRLDELEEQDQIKYQMHTESQFVARNAQRQPTVAVDLDGTLLTRVDYDAPLTLGGQPALGAPQRGAASAMRTFRELGWRVLVHTARFDAALTDDLDKVRAEIEDHLQHENVYFDEVWVGPKPVADVYIDDLAVPFKGDWYAVVREVTTQGPPTHTTPSTHEGVALIDTVDNPNDWTDPGESRRDLSIPRDPAKEHLLR